MTERLSSGHCHGLAPAGVPANLALAPKAGLGGWGSLLEPPWAQGVCAATANSGEWGVRPSALAPWMSALSTSPQEAVQVVEGPSTPSIRAAPWGPVAQAPSSHTPAGITPGPSHRQQGKQQLLTKLMNGIGAHLVATQNAKSLGRVWWL